MPAETATATTGENARAQVNRAQVNGLLVLLPLLGVAALIVVFSSGRSLAGQPSAPAGPAIT